MFPPRSRGSAAKIGVAKGSKAIEALIAATGTQPGPEAIAKKPQPAQNGKNPAKRPDPKKPTSDDADPLPLD